MLTPATFLTPMERQLLHRLQDLEESLQVQMNDQHHEIAGLKEEIRSRDRMITGLSATLSRLLGPEDQEESLLP